MAKLFDKKGHAVVIIPGAVQPSLQAWAINRSPLERRGAANGTFLSSMDLSFTIGSILLSFIAESKSYAVMYRFSSVFMIIFMMIYGVALFKEKKIEISKENLQENIS